MDMFTKNICEDAVAQPDDAFTEKIFDSIKIESILIRED